MRTKRKAVCRCAWRILEYCAESSPVLSLLETSVYIFLCLCMQCSWSLARSLVQGREKDKAGLSLVLTSPSPGPCRNAAKASLCLRELSSAIQPLPAAGGAPHGLPLPYFFPSPSLTSVLHLLLNAARGSGSGWGKDKTQKSWLSSWESLQNIWVLHDMALLRQELLTPPNQKLPICPEHKEAQPHATSS